jgi:hypothetical protein
MSEDSEATILDSITLHECQLTIASRFPLYDTLYTVMKAGQ